MYSLEKTENDIKMSSCNKNALIIIYFLVHLKQKITLKVYNMILILRYQIISFFFFSCLKRDYC